MKHGVGKFTWPDKKDRSKVKIYDGDWVNGRQHGFANYTNAKGKTQASKWENGKWVYWVDKDGKAIYGKPQSPNNIVEIKLNLAPSPNDAN